MSEVIGCLQKIFPHEKENKGYKINMSQVMAFFVKGSLLVADKIEFNNKKKC